MRIDVGLSHIPDKPGIAADLFEALSNGNLNVDLIIQSTHEGTSNDITFTVSQSQFEKAKEICNRNIETGIATAVNLRFYDSSTSNYISIVSGVNLPGQASIQPISAPLVLKAGDSLQVADRSGFADVTASIMEIT